MTQDDHFAHVRKLCEREFSDGDDKIQLTVTEFLGEITLEIGITNRYLDSASVDFKLDSVALHQFLKVINEVVLNNHFANVGKMVE